MDLVNFDDSQTVVSPTQFTNEGNQTPAPADVSISPDSSPLPPRSRQGSIGRKRTNEESWGPVESPKISPQAPTPLRRSVTIAAMPEPEGQLAGNHPFHATGDPPRSQEAVAGNGANGPTPPSDRSFVKDIREYQQQLELEYQDFERSLNERDRSANLEAMDWEELEAHYSDEISPCIAREKEIMEEFNARFAVCILLAVGEPN